MKRQLWMYLLAGSFFACIFAASPNAAEAQCASSSWTYGAWSAWTTASGNGSFNSGFKVCNKTEPVFPFRFWSARVWQDQVTPGAGWRRASVQRELLNAPPLAPTCWPSANGHIRIAVISDVLDFGTGTTSQVATPGFAPNCTTVVKHTFSGNQFISRSRCGVATCNP